MRLLIMYMSVVVLFVGSLYAQEGVSHPGVELVTYGPNYSNTPPPLAIERYGQTRTALISMPLGTRSRLQTGISETRIANRDVLEFPLLFDYQVTDKLHAFTGLIARVNYPLQATKEDVSMLNGTFMTIGAGYQIAPAWDASIQLVLPVIEDASTKGSSFETLQPIRMRTGFKF